MTGSVFKGIKYINFGRKKKNKFKHLKLEKRAVLALKLTISAYCDFQ